MRRPVAAAIAALMTIAGMVLSAAPAGADVPVLVIDGKGWGHGVGMAQDGAFWMGKAGANAAQILGHFYPGTGIGKATGTVRVVVLKPQGNDAMLAFPDGGQVQDVASGQPGPGFPVSVGSNGQIHVWFDGSQYHAQAVGGTAMASTHWQLAASVKSQTLPTLPGGGDTTTTTRPTTTTTTPPITTPQPTTPPPTTTPPQSTTTTLPGQPPPGGGGGGPPNSTTTVPPPPPPGAKPPPSSSRTLWALPKSTVALPATNRRYRGAVEFTATGGPLRMVDQLDVEQYLRGMGEVRDGTWPAAALQTQAISARTYALRAAQAGAELCDDDRCQVYLGQQAEYPQMDKAVSATAGQAVVFGKQMASTVYSANAGGFSATPTEGFGPAAADVPYLPASPYETHDLFPWNVRIGLPDLATRFQYAGTITAVRVSQAGPSGRATEVTFDGDKGSMAVDARKFAGQLGLRSTFFTVGIEQAAAAPVAPAPAVLIQVLPQDVAQASGSTAPVEDQEFVKPQFHRVETLKAAGHAGKHGLGWLPWLAVAMLLATGAAAGIIVGGGRVLRRFKLLS
ncbi:MAG: stage sporulation protein [Actinomycetota bacterium]|nr:stage sporulation protein [Actinomycetota bacterium]